MKRALLVMMLVFCAYNVKAEKQVGSYYNDYFKREYVIEASEPKGDSFTVYIEVLADSSDKAYVSIKSSEVPVLKLFLMNIRDKYSEWASVAKKNNVTDLNKEMDYKSPSLNICWSGSEWWFSYNHRLTPRFIILDNGQNVVSMVRKATSSSNEYIDETIYWVFNSAESINALINELNVDEILAGFKKDSNTSDLFN